MNVGLDWGQDRLLGAATFRIRKGAISFSSGTYWTSLSVVPIFDFLKNSTILLSLLLGLVHSFRVRRGA